jgi:hypothetical protein
MARRLRAAERNMLKITVVIGAGLIGVISGLLEARYPSATASGFYSIWQGGPGESGPPATVKLLPLRGDYLGLYYGAGSIKDTNRLIGTTPKVHLTYFDWTDDWTAAASTQQDLAAERIPLVNWEPFDVDFRDIVNGKADAMIGARAAAAAALPGQFFLDFAAEMNEEEGWGGHDPALYIATWRHIHDIFAQRGATNAVWVWAPNNTDSDGSPSALQYYPGSEYVDWVGIDGYNWGAAGFESDWETFDEVFGPMYDRLQALGKPIMIGETASAERGGRKSDWISDVLVQLQSRFANVRALVWFDVRKERDWRINSSGASLSAFRILAANPLFQQ